MDNFDDIILHELGCKMGFRGKMLTDLKSVIVDEETLQQFYNFIILYGSELSKPMIVHKFIIHIKEKLSYKQYHEFEEKYKECVLKMEKINIIRRLFVNIENNEGIEKVFHWIDNQNVSLKQVYDAVITYRNDFNVNEIITLIEHLHINKGYKNQFKKAII
ncbi:MULTISPECIES: hypothetical protein [Paenibacillus]|uniref:hypothetical protein n=1 Tax=Paenibacillus TaxID=44249 RepID=UPI0022812D57|nr:hypothetical protein [Paenibacillus alvei]MCY7484935.1 hypothetical protein [Paenibacillus alvei]